MRNLVADSAALDALISSVSTANGVYGLKVFTAHFELAEKLRWTERLPKLQFILLEREDVLGQALSLSRALQTAQYRQNRPASANPKYDRRLIAEFIARITYGTARWRSYFARNGVTPLKLTYESVSASPEEALRSVADYIGVTDRVEIDESKIDIGIQRDQITEEWRQRFLKESGDLGYLDGGLVFSGRRGGGRVSRFFLGPGSSCKRARKA